LRTEVNVEPSSYENWLETELFENAPLNISVIDRDYNIVQANRNFVTLFGRARGRKCFEVHMRRDQICESCSVARTFADGKVRVNEEVGVDVSGRTAHYLVHVAPIRSEDGRIDYVIEMSTDITETKRLKLEYQTLFEQVPCYVTVLNRDLRVVKANRRFRQTFGEVSGGHCFEAFKHQNRACRTCPARETFTDGEIHTSEQVGVAKDGETTHYVVTTAPASRGDAGFSHVIEMAVDVTALRRVEQEKIEAERLAAVGQTVAGLAHGIKNILTGLEGGMYFLKSGLTGGKQERLDEGWGMLTRNMDKISVLVRNLLSFSKGRVPKVQMNKPEELVAETVALYREAAAAEGITVEAKMSGNLAPAPYDSESIHTCLANLVSNAVDACKMGGKTPCRVSVRARDENGALVFEVEDEGCGMDQEVRKLAFTNFFSTKGSGGTGLGLLLTRKISQEHGGRVEFDSTPGQGSVFRLIFPRDRLPVPTEDTGERGEA
jgi:PAS domain S-box-containing protein